MHPLTITKNTNAFTFPISLAILDSGGADGRGSHGASHFVPRWGKSREQESHNSTGSNRASAGSGGAPTPATVGITGIHRRGSLQLWQFLLALLNDPGNHAAIVWTGRGMEFKLIEPEEVKSFFDGDLWFK